MVADAQGARRWLSSTLRAAHRTVRHRLAGLTTYCSEHLFESLEEQMRRGKYRVDRVPELDLLLLFGITGSMIGMLVFVTWRLVGGQ